MAFNVSIDEGSECLGPFLQCLDVWDGSGDVVVFQFEPMVVLGGLFAKQGSRSAFAN